MDGDSDGYGDETDAGTASCTAVVGSVTNNTDCNDGSFAINDTTVWYEDTDADGFADGTNNITVCEEPA